jgi:hypothetical protein
MVPTTALISELPREPAIYVMYGGEKVGAGWVAYVGEASDLRSRLEQHFVRRDSSAVAGASAVGLKVENIRYVEWWQHERFADDDQRHAAELLAFTVFDPVMRSRGRPRRAAVDHMKDASFARELRAVLEGPPAGRLVLPSMLDLAARVTDLEARVAALEAHG